MSDTIQHLQLPGAQLERIERDGEDRITLHFSRVQLVQEMEGAFENSLWTQAVRLTLHDIELEGELPACPCELQGGDLTNNIYTWRNQVPLPIGWRGDVGCKLTVAGTDAVFSIRANRMSLEQIDYPRYIKHIKKGEV
jgi:hypothetical protein